MIERTLVFGENGGLVGTVCLPATGKGAAVGMVLFNAGILHRVGPHRLNVRLARNLASRGIPSIRFDLSGLGDSERSASTRSFDEQAVVDLRSAMDALAQEAGVGAFAMLGFCSGGRHVYAAAPQDPRVVGIYIYDTWAFPTLRSRWNRRILRLRRDGLRGALLGWTRHRLARLAGAARRVSGGEGSSAGADASGYVNVRVPTAKEFADVVRPLCARGVSVALACSGESESYNYRDQFRDGFRGTGIEDLVACEYLPGIDHTILLRSWQADFAGRVEAFAVAVDDRVRRRPVASPG